MPGMPKTAGLSQAGTRVFAARVERRARERQAQGVERAAASSSACLSGKKIMQIISKRDKRRSCPKAALAGGVPSQRSCGAASGPSFGSFLQTKWSGQRTALRSALRGASCFSGKEVAQDDGSREWTQAQMGLVAKLRSALLPARGQGAANLGGGKAASRVCGRASAALASTRLHGEGQCVRERKKEGGRSASAVPAPCTAPCSVLEGAFALVTANISRKGLRVVPTRAAGSRVATISGRPCFSKDIVRVSAAAPRKSGVVENVATDDPLML